MRRTGTFAVTAAQLPMPPLENWQTLSPDSNSLARSWRVRSATSQNGSPKNTCAYAVTSYGSQGKTMDYVLFSDSAVRAATNSRQWYVTISRGRPGIRIFTSDKTALRENVLRSEDSKLALDLIGRERIQQFQPRRQTRLWRRWTHGWNTRARNLLVKVKSLRLMQPRKNETYGHKIN